LSEEKILKMPGEWKKGKENQVIGGGRRKKKK